jgi:hypothetical protein
MMKVLKKLFGRDSGRKPPPAGDTLTRSLRTPVSPKSVRETAPETVERDPRLSRRLQADADKPPRSAREPDRDIGADRGEDLISMDDQASDSMDEHGFEMNGGAGIDPYNSGKFDRSKNWDKRYRK